MDAFLVIYVICQRLLDDVQATVHTSQINMVVWYQDEMF